MKLIVWEISEAKGHRIANWQATIRDLMRRRYLAILETAKNVVRRTHFYRFVEYAQQRYDYHHWIKRGKAGPAPHICKQAIIRAYARTYGLRTLIETGTYLGSMINAMKGEFDEIISIELDQKLSEMARRRFAGYGHISIVRGDSAEILPKLLQDVRKPCLFWLDGHYSGGVTAKGATETPIVQELLEILRHPVDGHVVLVDDARKFNGEGDYPTLAEIRRLVDEHRPDWKVAVKEDIIQICS